jgi:PPM family protein phosphatase
MLRIAEEWHGSDLGRRRQGNEDNYYVRAPVFVVADGMGGAQAGEVASEMAVEAFGRGLPRHAPPADGLVRVIEDANRRIHADSRAHAERAGMGTTVTAAHVGEDAVTIAHVGDSRAYLLRDGDLIRLTRDHSLVGELVARGKLTEEQAEAHPQRSVVTRVLGPEPAVQVDVETFPARDGDLFLLCSDGLTGMVHEPQVRDMLRSGRPLAEVGRELIAAANAAGGRDNITVILFRVEAVTFGGGRRAPADEPATSEFAASPEPHTRELDVAAGATRAHDEAPRATAGDETEAEYRRGATVALSPVRPRARPLEEPGGAGARRAEAPRGRGPRRRRRLRPGLVIAALVVVGLLVAAWSATREVYFVGTDPERGNAVTIYRGLPYEGPFGTQLYSPVVSTGVTLANVPAERRHVFTDHRWRSRKSAQALVLALERGELQ